MKYTVDHDLHIHSKLSKCSQDPEQNNKAILRYGQENGLCTICLTDHFWDECVEGASKFYLTQNYEHVSSAKPLPQGDGIRFLFGCETELNRKSVLGLSEGKFDLFDFIVIPTTHFHSQFKAEPLTVRDRAKVWAERFDAVLNMDLPFHKVGLAHLTCHLIAPTREEYLEALDLIPDSEMEGLFARAAKTGVGIELNGVDMSFAEHEADTVLRIYRIAKKMGCKFYLGSDAHHLSGFHNVKELFERAVELLQLSEEDKFILR